MTQTRPSPTPQSKTIFLFLLAGGLLFIGIAIVLLYLPEAQDQVLANGYSAVPEKVNIAAPALRLTNLDGKPVMLSDYLGKVVLVNNWATWCPPCKAEMPTLESYYIDHQAQNFVIIAIESGETQDEVADFVTQYSLTFPVWLDERGIALDAFQNWDLPSSFVIDEAGTIVLTWTGSISRAMLDKYVTPLLEK
jgi:peroxiredoxin